MDNGATKDSTVLEEFEGWMNDAKKIKGPYITAYTMVNGEALIFDTMMFTLKNSEFGGDKLISTFAKTLKEWITDRTVYVRSPPIVILNADQSMVARCRLAVVDDNGVKIDSSDFGYEGAAVNKLDAVLLKRVMVSESGLTT